MAATFTVKLEGLQDAIIRAGGLDRPHLRRYASQAINKTLDRARTSAAKQMRQEINFKAGYLTGQNGRLETAKSSEDTLEGAITGRFRPTSLARFATSTNVSASRKKHHVLLEVDPGNRVDMQGAFLVQLPGSKAETIGNLGVAIRLKPGESIRHKTGAVAASAKLAPNLYLLYGPSVDQVFRTVAQDIQPEMAQFLVDEFTRLVDLGTT